MESLIPIGEDWRYLKKWPNLPFGEKVIQSEKSAYRCKSDSIGDFKKKRSGSLKNQESDLSEGR
jgi:hypothetical protein